MEWIYCKDRMPEIGQKVLVAYVVCGIGERSEYTIGQRYKLYDNSIYWLFNSEGVDSDDDVYAWAELPDLPEPA